MGIKLHTKTTYLWLKLMGELAISGTLSLLLLLFICWTLGVTLHELHVVKPVKFYRTLNVSRFLFLFLISIIIIINNNSNNSNNTVIITIIVIVFSCNRLILLKLQNKYVIKMLRGRLIESFLYWNILRLTLKNYCPIPSIFLGIKPST